MNLRNLTREAIEQLNDIEPYCFETDREEQWFNIGLQYGLDVADSHPKSPWISIDDDLPCNHEGLMAKRLFSYEKETVHVLTLLPDGDIVIDFMVCNRGKWKWWSHHRPTHWFPIPEPPKE